MTVFHMEKILLIRDAKETSASPVKKTGQSESSGEDEETPAPSGTWAEGVIQLFSLSSFHFIPLLILKSSGCFASLPDILESQCCESPHG